MNKSNSSAQFLLSRSVFASTISCCVLLLLLLTADRQLGAAELKEARVTQVVQDVKLLPRQAAPRPARISDEVRNGTAVRTGVDSREIGRASCRERV